MGIARLRGCAAAATLSMIALVIGEGCGSDGSPTSDPSSTSSSGGASSGGTSSSGGASSGGASSGGPATNPDDGPAAGNPDGKCAVPAEAQAESIANPRTVVGTGTPASCTGEAFVDAVAKGGIITFDCGAAPTTIKLTTTAKVFNNTGPKIVIDGGNKVTLSGDGKVRILYQNTCDKAQVWTSSECNEQPDPQLTLQNLTFIDGNAKGLETGSNEGGGGAVYVRGGRLKIIHSRFFHNVCDDLGSDVGGGAIRVLDNHKAGSIANPVYIVDSTFGGKPGYGNTCANGGALSSIGASYTILNTVFTDSHAIGTGANSGQGGNGGAIYNDGNTFALDVCGTLMEDNHANEGGSAIFFVSNNQTGTITIRDSILRNNPKGKFETAGFPGMFVKAKGAPIVTGSTIQ